jgi:abortive infection Abi-like protein
MIQAPVSDEVAGTLAGFFYYGAGPSHSKIGSVFASAGYGDDDPYSPVTQTPNKEDRVLAVFRAARRRPGRARDLVDALLVQLRVTGCFDPERTSVYDQYRVRTAQRAFKQLGWVLSDDGYLSAAGAIDLATGGRAALDEQVDRLRRATEDPGQLLGSAKDLLEAVAKFVLEEFSVPAAKKNDDFDHLWYLARDRLSLLPTQVNSTLPGASNIKAILQSSWAIAEQVNKLRGFQGTGHGRTLPTGVSADMALLVVREACSVAEFVLATLDRATGRAA